MTTANHVPSNLGLCLAVPYPACLPGAPTCSPLWYVLTSLRQAGTGPLPSAELAVAGTWPDWASSLSTFGKRAHTHTCAHRDFRRSRGTRPDAEGKGPHNRSGLPLFLVVTVEATPSFPGPQRPAPLPPPRLSPMSLAFARLPCWAGCSSGAPVLALALVVGREYHLGRSAGEMPWMMGVNFVQPCRDRSCSSSCCS